ncbi:MAG: nucleotidyltransferase [Bacteroidales bacterium]|nr:nucleotidyltransferase [Bacteroidales bacterium]
MIFTEQQLERFSNPPPKYQSDQIKRTQETIKEVLQKNIPNAQIREQFEMESFNYDIYLQGSYKNNTNIANSSDVDIVIELTSMYYYDTQLLSESHRIYKNRDNKPSKYSFSEFKNAVLSALVKEFGNTIIKRDNKCLRFRGHKNYCDADIIPCCTYKQYLFYENYSNSRANEGIEFQADSGEWIVNFPHQHFVSLNRKSESTSGNFKESVRMFKNFREQLIENRKISAGCAKSYFIENMLYNVPDNYFAGNFTERFKAIFDKLATDFNNNTIDNYICANGINNLFSDKTWRKDLCKEYLLGLNFIRDNNAF